MSEPDQNKIISRITKKLLWAIIPMMLVFFALDTYGDIKANKKKANESYVEGHYFELYRLIAELSTTQSMYIQANDKDKAALSKRIDYIIERMDKFTYKDVKRGTSMNTQPGRTYGFERTSLL